MNAAGPTEKHFTGLSQARRRSSGGAIRRKIHTSSERKPAALSPRTIMILLWPWAKLEQRAVCAERCTYGSGRRSALALLTPLHLAEEFGYLAVILDAFSRKVVGWALDAHLRAELAISALTMAITARQPKRGALIHHSDRGVQGEFNRLSQHQVIGGFDGRSQTCIRSMHPKKVVLTRTPVCLAT